PAFLPGSAQTWKASDGAPLIAGISSFGFSGTNAHVIVKEAPKGRSESRQETDRSLHVLALSAQGSESLFELAQRYEESISTISPSMIGDLLYTAKAGRTHFGERVACIGRDRDELVKGLKEFQISRQSSPLVYYEGHSVGKASKITVLFPEAETQQNMEVSSVLATTPFFRRCWNECEALFEPHISSRLAEVDFDCAIPLDRAAYAFCVSYSSFRLLEHWGLQVNSVYGEKEGLYSMAAAVGLLSLESAVVHLIRRYCSTSCPEFTSYSLTMPKVRVLWQGKDRALVRADLKEEDLIEEAYEQTLSREAAADLLPTENRSFIELSAVPCILQSFENPSISSSSIMLYAKNSIECGLVQAVAHLYSLGHQVNWKAFDEGPVRRRVLAPIYPFRKRSYWIPSIDNEGDAKMSFSAAVGVRAGNPFEGRLFGSPSREKRIVYYLNLEHASSLRDTHGVVHVGYFVEMLDSGMNACGYSDWVTREMAFEVALILTESEDREVQLLIDAPGDGLNFSFYSRASGSSEWTRHVSGCLDVETCDEMSRSGKKSLASIRKILPKRQLESGLNFYEELEDRGVQLGQSVRWIEQVWSKEGEALARFRPALASEKKGAFGIPFHPGVWDACAQLFHATLDGKVLSDSSFMVTEMGRVSVRDIEAETPLWCHARSTGHPDGDGILEGEFVLYTDRGEVVAYSRGYRMKELTLAHKKALSESVKPNGSGLDTVLLNSLLEAPSSSVQIDRITAYVRSTLASLLRLPEDEVGLNESSLDLGMDSLV
ncbi:MAG: hypothetical protein HOI66_10570, partial [Verrucomicrobia bacterium]|nr:hypothetical protein [Verrucomicrobiota bacterium]